VYEPQALSALSDSLADAVLCSGLRHSLVISDARRFQTCWKVWAAVQYSVFECVLTQAKYDELPETQERVKLSEDSVRFYPLSKHTLSQVETWGEPPVTKCLVQSSSSLGVQGHSNGCSIDWDVVNLDTLPYKAFSDFIVPSFSWL